MIKIQIELLPRGVSEYNRKNLLGMAWIVNDGTGTDKRGNYDIKMQGKTPRSFKQVRVKDFPRQSYPVWKLLYLALDKIYGKEK